MTLSSACGSAGVQMSGNFCRLPLISDLSVLTFDYLHRHDVQPPLHHAVRLREEAMSADIDAIAFVSNSPGNTADIVALFQNKRHYVRTR